MAVYSFKEIIEMQKLTLDEKVEISIEIIKEGLLLSQSKCALAFSGGKDSQVLWHLLKTYFSKEHKEVAIIFGNTGCEFPESLQFARKLKKKWAEGNFYETKLSKTTQEDLKYQAQVEVLKWLTEQGRIAEVLKPDGKLKTTRILYKKCTPELLEDFRKRKLVWKKGQVKNYLWCCDQYGYPILGKSFSKLKARRINIDTFLEHSQSASEDEELLKYYELLRRVKISQACCDVLKKEPSERIQKELKVDVIFKGLMASESHTRKVNFSTRGYIFKSSRKYLDIPFYHCNPISHWTDDDIWEYIYTNNLEYSPLYDIEYEAEDGSIKKIKRNGCIGCFTDFGRKNSHMYVLRQTHNSIWKWVMKHGMGEQLAKIRTFEGKHRKQSALDAIAGVETQKQTDNIIEWAIENRPCAFD